MKKIAFLIIASLVSLTACKNQKKEENTPSQMEQVMAVHDEVMPKMSTISKLIRELEVKVDSTEKGMQYKAAQEDLQEANHMMMQWMEGFSTRFDSDEIMNGKALTEQKLIWLDEEEVKVKALKEKMISSITNAELLLRD